MMQLVHLMYLTHLLHLVHPIHLIHDATFASDLPDLDLVHLIHLIHDAFCASDVQPTTMTTNMSEPLTGWRDIRIGSLNDTTLKQKVVFGQTGGGTSQACPGN